LAGFSFALIGLVIPSASDLRWPGAALALLVVSGIAFVMAVQCGFWAQMWVVMPSEIHEWVPHDPPARTNAELRLHAHGFRIWAKRVNACYRIGLLALLFAVLLILIPPGDIDGARWIAIIAAALGVGLEALWMASSWLLMGSPDTIYSGEQDVPEAGTKHMWIREVPVLRRVARRVEPIVEEPGSA
jgi:hypothetical protein